MNDEGFPWGYRPSNLETPQKRPRYDDTFSEEINHKQHEVIEKNNQDPK